MGGACGSLSLRWRLDEVRESGFSGFLRSFY